MLPFSRKQVLRSRKKKTIMSAQLEPKRFNVTEYYKMAEAGILKPDDRVELIDGKIITMSPIGSPHAACVRGDHGGFEFLDTSVFVMMAGISIITAVR